MSNSESGDDVVGWWRTSIIDMDPGRIAIGWAIEAQLATDKGKAVPMKIDGARD